MKWTLKLNGLHLFFILLCALLLFCCLGPIMENLDNQYTPEQLREMASAYDEKNRQMTDSRDNAENQEFERRRMAYDADSRRNNSGMRLNQDVENALDAFIKEHPHDWEQLIKNKERENRKRKNNTNSDGFKRPPPSTIKKKM